jgi:hypothetical protein
MKHKTKVMAVIAAILLFNFNIKAQVTIPVNGPGVVGDYVGWNARQFFPLTIQHLGTAVNQTINFSTGSVQRMTILNTPGNGFVGIGNNFMNPLHQLDVRNGDGINVGNKNLT